jgi:hypothetical protein
MVSFFLSNTNCIISYEVSGIRSETGLYSEVYLTPNNVIIGDPYYGYYCYNPQTLYQQLYKWEYYLNLIRIKMKYS